MSAPSWDLSSEAEMVQVQAVLTRLDVGAGHARIRIYTTAQPADGKVGNSDTPQCTLTLAKPCGAIVGSALTLYLQDATGALVMHTGLPRWADIVAADDVVLFRGAATDMDHGGVVRVRGADTPEGETSPLFYAGGKLQLGAVMLT